ncbi:hypothetical protein [Spirillospora sp. CA-294931]|uniref:hypothetical protein n=1 Tax=Spirillospora sp. CA-294931 TaxID=3240042 RepID=UPI003D90B0EB
MQRDSLFILDTIHTIDGGPRPETVVTDTASYSDVLIRCLIVPAARQLLGARAWWMPDRLARLLPTVAIERPEHQESAEPCWRPQGRPGPAAW